MPVEVPDLLRRAMGLRGVDPDAVAAQAQALEDAGGVDAIPERTPPQRRKVEEPGQETLPDPAVNDVGGWHHPDSDAPDTERAAAIAQYPKSGTDRRRVLDWIAGKGVHGSTDEEASLGLSMRLYTAAPRRTELVDAGWVCDSGKRRATTTGSMAAVWVLTEQGRQQWEPPQLGYDRD